MTKPVPPPTVDQTRQVILQTPGGMQVVIHENDIVRPWRMDEDEVVARAYAEATGLPTTVRRTIQTTVHPPKVTE